MGYSEITEGGGGGHINITVCIFWCVGKLMEPKIKSGLMQKSSIRYSDSISTTKGVALSERRKALLGEEVMAG